jgi:hypothetical protein
VSIKNQKYVSGLYKACLASKSPKLNPSTTTTTKKKKKKKILKFHYLLNQINKIENDE